MTQFDSVKKSFNLFTGKTGRQAKAFRALSDWSATVHKFLTTYDLYGSHSLDTLLAKVGQAKFELVGITYTGRSMIDQSKVFKGTNIPDNVEVIVGGAEALRRYLIDPELRNEALNKAVTDLRVDYENLREAMEKEHQRLTS